MTTLTATQLHDFLANAAIEAASPERGIGRELTYRPPAPRTIVVHFGSDDSSEYITRVISILLQSAESWLLAPRYGSASQLRELTTVADAEALLFAPSERDRLASYLCTRDMSMRAISQDIYLVSGDGNTLIVWDHHTEDEGLEVALRDIVRSSALLADLNTFGAELEVFYFVG